MTRLSGFVAKQGQSILANNRQAVLCAIALALLPYTAWLSSAVIALVTLRKGVKNGSLLLAFVMVAHLVLSILSIPVGVAIANTTLIFIPGFIAACALRLTASWRAIASLFFMLILLAIVFIQACLPEFIIAQYNYIQTLLRESQSNNSLADFFLNAQGYQQIILANYVFGIQVVSVLFSSIFSLMVARSVQSQLYYPGGFRQEMLTFRCHKLDLVLLLVIVMAALQHHVIAINLMPMLVLHFLLAGLSLCASALEEKKMRNIAILLLAPLVLLPFVVLPFYVILGFLDSLFNLRIYFSRTQPKRG